MTDDQPQDKKPDDIGSVGEEAMKLLGAFADLARQHGGDAAGGVGNLAGQAAAMAHEVGEHIATDAVECKYCPVCRVVHAVRQTSPEVKAHLMVAASSLLQAAASLMETSPENGTRTSEVQRIDLDDPEEPTP
ncbi:MULTISPECIES: hypothetical protein [unclassified Nocardioides]|uniref:hypothetical protein n=1 Tax=unclassified Nocardioides TaxID=2615069 RepID=UPI00114F6854|nr:MULTISPECIES: hypothetical protein [unclassified Nocardioides]TQK70626.1 hypothetical protein FBY23_2405 [Nocardioides sp. SLBN-35]WGX99986.1 hypothetical protein QI633_15720 [Nocardioides sp. QY071]